MPEESDGSPARASRLAPSRWEGTLSSRKLWRFGSSFNQSDVWIAPNITRSEWTVSRRADEVCAAIKRILPSKLKGGHHEMRAVRRRNWKRPALQRTSKRWASLCRDVGSIYRCLSCGVVIEVAIVLNEQTACQTVTEGRQCLEWDIDPVQPKNDLREKR